jgi:hypothetical protein
VMMGRTWSEAEWDEADARVAAAEKADKAGQGIRPHPREHLSTPDCWCHPIEESPGVWVHNDALPFEGYVPDLQGVIEGDDAL